MKKEIIPVTCSIRNYLISEKDNELIYESLYHKLHFFEYRIFKRNGAIHIERDSMDSKLLYEKEIYEKIQFFMEVAEKLHKSLVWVYQEMVLYGYGYDIKSNSDIFKASMMAYEDVSYIRDKFGDEEAFLYEENVILNSRLYDKLIESNRSNKKILKMK